MLFQTAIQSNVFYCNFSYILCPYWFSFLSLITYPISHLLIPIQSFPSSTFMFQVFYPPPSLPWSRSSLLLWSSSNFMTYPVPHTHYTHVLHRIGTLHRGEAACLSEPGSSHLNTVISSSIHFPAKVVIHLFSLLFCSNIVFPCGCTS